MSQAWKTSLPRHLPTTEGVGIKLALYVYMSGVDAETADSAVEQVLSAYRDCLRVLGRDLLAEVKSLMPARKMAMWMPHDLSFSRGASMTELCENLVDGLLRLGHRLFFPSCQSFES